MSLNYEILYELYKIEPIKVRQMHERDLAIKEASLIKDNLNVEISTLRQELQLSLEEVRNESHANKNFAIFRRNEIEKMTEYHILTKTIV